MKEFGQLVCDVIALLNLVHIRRMFFVHGFLMMNIRCEIDDEIADIIEGARQS